MTSFFSRYRHQCIMYGTSLVMILSMLPLLFHREEDNAALRDVAESEAFRVYVNAAAAVAAPLTFDVIIDVCTSRKLMPQLFSRAFICFILLFTSFMHYYFVINKKYYYAAIVIKQMGILSISPVLVHQLLLRGQGIISLKYYYAIFVCSTLGNLWISYDIILPTLAGIGIVLCFLSILVMWAVVYKHISINMRMMSGAAWYKKLLRRSAFEVLIFLIGLIASVMILIYSNGDLNYERSGKSLIGISSAMVVVLIILSAIITNQYRRDYSYVHQKLGAKRMFVRYMSHEIRTPLNAAMLGLQLLEERMTEKLNKKKLNGPVQAMLKGMHSLSEEVRLNTEIAVTVLNDLLQYDKIEVGTLQLDVDVTDIWKVMNDSVYMFSAQAEHAGVHLRVIGPFTDPTLSHDQRNMISGLHVRGDSVRLSQAFRNLVSNALKFSSEADTVDVTMEWRERGLPGANIPTLPIAHAAAQYSMKRCGSLVFTVTDHGAGMSRTEVESLFQEGVQFQANRLQAGGGSGLGLFISKGIVELHGGVISAASVGYNCGSTFTIELPLCRFEEDPPVLRLASLAMSSLTAFPRHSVWPNGEKNEQVSDFDFDFDNDVAQLEGGAQATNTSSSGSSSMSDTSGRKKALIVDDAKSNRKMVAAILERHGFLCDLAVDGMDCLKILEDNSDYDVILMDNLMPRMTGPEATQIIRERYGLRLLVIGLTGNVLKEDAELFKKQGADAVLSKPLVVSELFSLMERFANRRKI